jgi:sulfatase modifying factor 1
MEKNFDKGMSAMKDKHYHTAIEYFTKCIEANPENFEALFQRGVAKSYMGSYIGDPKIKDRIGDFTLAIDLNPNYFEAFLERGTSYWNLENYEMAILDFSKAIEIQPSATKIYSDRAYSYILMERFKEAIPDLDYYIDNVKSSSQILWAYRERAFANLKLKNYSNAILDFNKILPDDNHSDYYLERAKAYFALGKYMDASTDFNALLKIDQDNPKAIFLLNLVGELNKVKNIENARTLGDFVLSFYDFLSVDDFENLLKEANDCIKFYPKFYLGYIFRALVYIENKEYTKINTDIDIALKLKPHDELALKLYKAIPAELQKTIIPTDTISQKKRESILTGFLRKLKATSLFSNESTIQWVNIKTGSFIMGSPIDEEERNNEPQVQVTISAFKISKYAVTFEQFDLFCQATSRVKPEDEGWGRGKLPVININWYDAQEFAKWMGCRLPTGAEWEYACRAGTTTPFNTGKNLTTSQANYDGYYPYNKNIKGETRKRTLPVGSFPPNAWGLYDMHGNVWEWCTDWVNDFHDGYSSNLLINPIGPSNGSYRMVRGGSYCTPAHNVRSARIGGGFPLISSPDRGFRVVLCE